MIMGHPLLISDVKYTLFTLGFIFSEQDIQAEFGKLDKGGTGFIIFSPVANFGDQSLVVNFIIQKLKSKHSSLKKYTN